MYILINILGGRIGCQCSLEKTLQQQKFVTLPASAPLCSVGMRKVSFSKEVQALAKGTNCGRAKMMYFGLYAVASMLARLDRMKVMDQSEM